MEDLGRRLRLLRGNRSPQAAARDLGITVQALSAYETGKRRPRDEICHRAAMLYRVPEAWLRQEAGKARNSFFTR